MMRTMAPQTLDEQRRLVLSLEVGCIWPITVGITIKWDINVVLAD